MKILVHMSIGLSRYNKKGGSSAVWFSDSSKFFFGKMHLNEFDHCNFSVLLKLQ